MSRRYPPEVHRQVVELARSGTKVSQLTEVFGVSQAAIYDWLKQERVDRGEIEGLSTDQALEQRPQIVDSTGETDRDSAETRFGRSSADSIHSGHGSRGAATIHNTNPAGVAHEFWLGAGPDAARDDLPRVRWHPR